MHNIEADARTVFCRHLSVGCHDVQLVYASDLACVLEQTCLAERSSHCTNERCNVHYPDHKACSVILVVWPLICLLAQSSEIRAEGRLSLYPISIIS